MAGGRFPALGYVPAGTLTDAQAAVYNALIAKGVTPDRARFLALRVHGDSPVDVYRALGQSLANSVLSAISIGASELGGINPYALYQAGKNAFEGKLRGGLLTSPLFESLIAGAPPKTGIGRPPLHTQIQSRQPLDHDSMVSDVLRELPQIVRQIEPFARRVFPSLFGQQIPPQSPTPELAPQPYTEPAPSYPIESQPDNTTVIPQQFDRGAGGGEPLEITNRVFPPDPINFPYTRQPSGDQPTLIPPGHQGGTGSDQPIRTPGHQGGCDCPPCQEIADLEHQLENQISDQRRDQQKRDLTNPQHQAQNELEREARDIADQLNKPSSIPEKQNLLERLTNLGDQARRLCQKAARKLTFCMECGDQNEAMKFLNGEVGDCRVIPDSTQQGGEPYRAQVQGPSVPGVPTYQAPNHAPILAQAHPSLDDLIDEGYNRAGARDVQNLENASYQDVIDYAREAYYDTSKFVSPANVRDFASETAYMSGFIKKLQDLAPDSIGEMEFPGYDGADSALHEQEMDFYRTHD